MGTKPMSEHLWQGKSHPRPKVERMLGKLGGEEADKDEVWRSAWSVWTHIANEVPCDFAVSVIVWGGLEECLELVR